MRWYKKKSVCSIIFFLPFIFVQTITNLLWLKNCKISFRLWISCSGSFEMIFVMIYSFIFRFALKLMVSVTRIKSKIYILRIYVIQWNPDFSAVKPRFFGRRGTYRWYDGWSKKTVNWNHKNAALKTNNNFTWFKCDR